MIFLLQRHACVMSLQYGFLIKGDKNFQTKNDLIYAVPTLNIETIQMLVNSMALNISE